MTGQEPSTSAWVAGLVIAWAIAGLLVTALTALVASVVWLIVRIVGAVA